MYFFLLQQDIISFSISYWFMLFADCTVDRAVYRTDRHAGTPTRQWILFITAWSMDDDDEEKRTEHNLTVCSGKSEAEITNNRRLRSTYVHK